MLRVSDRAGSQQDSRFRHVVYCLPPSRKDVGVPFLLISRLNGWPAGVPLSTLRHTPHDVPRMTRGQDGSLLLSWVGLSPTITCQFVLAHSAFNVAAIFSCPANSRCPK